MNAARERVLIRTLHLVLSIPILGFLYGPVSHIPPAAFFTRFIAVPLVVASGLWLWLKPRMLRWWRQQFSVEWDLNRQGVASGRRR